MKYLGIIGLALAVATLPADAKQSNQPMLFEVAEVDRETVPAGAPEAFEAAFGRNTRTDNARWYQTVREIDGQAITFVPLTLIPLPGGKVALVSTGASDCTGHACSGFNSVHYLHREGARYQVDGEWLAVGASGTLGNPAWRWGWTDAIADAPVLYTEGGGVWQGYACAYASLTHLTPTGPVEIANIPVHYSNSGAAAEETDIVTLTGHIIAAEKDQSFTVRYTGSRTFNEQYVRGADGRYNLARRSQMPRC